MASRFLRRTVLVCNSDVAGAFRSLEKIMHNEKLIEEARRRTYFEKPYQKRNRLSIEKCKRIYDYEMQRKISFVIRKNRVDPWPR